MFFPMIFTAILFSLVIFCVPHSVICKLTFVDLLNSKFSSSFFSFAFDSISLLFLSMVFLVTSLVLLFSEFYMDYYGNKKFFFLMMAFLCSMVVLSTSGSFLNMVVGWDGLGISSLFLIMFYPNKIALYNSFLTFFFNRLGDVLLLGIFTIFIFYPWTLFFLSGNLTLLVLGFFLACSFTKSAQFPLSSWLPAAMSAPTPISAMVHSSTLVTAGVFILMKTFFFLDISNLNKFVLIFSFTTFLFGGWLANAELDLKKIVAFSTMSQISMILVILFMGMLFLSVWHTFIHALFKTSLFCSCGLMFCWNFSDQLSKIMKSSKVNFSSFFFVTLSVFSMSGLMFSASFFSKDVTLEILLLETEASSFFLLLLGGMLTILYSSSIMNSFSKNSHSFIVFLVSMKKYYFPFLMIFSFFMLICHLPLVEGFPLGVIPCVAGMDSIFLTFMIMLPFIFSNSEIKMKFPMISFEIVFSKFFSFSIWGKILGKDVYQVGLTDQILFKPFLIPFFMLYKESDEILLFFISCMVFLLLTL